MRKKAAVVGTVVFLCCLCLCCCVMMGLFALTKQSDTAVYELSEDISREEVVKMFEKDSEERAVCDGALFWKKEKGQQITNREFFRSRQADAYTLCGDSTILWADAYPLDYKDERGCLLGDKLADALFGSENIIGEEVSWQGKVFQVRGIIRDSEVFAAEGTKETEFCNVSVYGHDEMEKQRLMENLENAYGLNGTRVDAPLFSKEDMPQKVSDLTGWKNYLKAQWEKVKKMVEKTYNLV